MIARLGLFLRWLSCSIVWPNSPVVNSTSLFLAFFLLKRNPEARRHFKGISIVQTLPGFFGSSRVEASAQSRARVEEREEEEIADGIEGRQRSGKGRGRGGRRRECRRRRRRSGGDGGQQDGQRQQSVKDESHPLERRSRRRIGKHRVRASQC